MTTLLSITDATPMWLRAYPSKFSGVCRFCGGQIAVGELGMKYLVGNVEAYGHARCPEVPVTPVARPAKDAPSADFSSLVKHFEGVASRGGKRAKINFKVGNDDLTMKWSAKTGKINITHQHETVWNDRFGELPRWYGRVNADGTLTRGGQMTVAIEEEISSWGEDIIANAVRYAKLSGNCCFCGKFIETRESLAVGYGPVCADTHGLPWG